LAAERGHRWRPSSARSETDTQGGRSQSLVTWHGDEETFVREYHAPREASSCVVEGFGFPGRRLWSYSSLRISTLTMKMIKTTTSSASSARQVCQVAA
jgi:hypothetical protein